MKRILLFALVLAVADAAVLWFAFGGTPESLPVVTASQLDIQRPISLYMRPETILSRITPAVESANPSILRLKLACLIALGRNEDAADAARVLVKTGWSNLKDRYFAAFAYYCAGMSEEARKAATELEKYNWAESDYSLRQLGRNLRMHLEMAEAVRSGSREHMLKLLADQNGAVLDKAVLAHPLFGGATSDAELRMSWSSESTAIALCSYGLLNRIRGLFASRASPAEPRELPFEAEWRDEIAARNLYIGGARLKKGLEEIWLSDLFDRRKPIIIPAFAVWMADAVAHYRESDLHVGSDYLAQCDMLLTARCYLAASTVPGGPTFPNWPEPVRYLLVSESDKGTWTWDLGQEKNCVTAQISADIARMLRNSCK